jgi:predicted esterase
MPLLVLFHGAGGAGDRMLARVSAYTDEAGIAVLSPSSQDSSWDAIRGDFDVDVAMIDKALAKVFDQLPIDPKHVIVGGFSDGASYALSLGLINGDLFKHVLAFSPGFIVPGQERERPRVFISHGMEDPILPYERCGKRIAADLKGRGFDVTFSDFHGGHEIPLDIGRAEMAWALK